MRLMTKWVKTVLIIFVVLSAVLFIWSVIAPEQGHQQFVIWYRMTAALQIFSTLVCLRLIRKLERLQRLREENEKLKSELEQNGGVK